MKTKPRNCMELLRARWSDGKFVCVGLDSDLEKIPRSCVQVLRQAPPDFIPGPAPEETIVDFNKAIVDATSDLVCAYKPNFAFYAKHGPDGLVALARTVAYIHKQAPDVPVILDGKWGDIGNTNAGYASFAFDYCRADAVTLNPYMGRVAMEPFLKFQDKMCFILCKTSNEGSGEFQDLLTSKELDASFLVSLYEKMAGNVALEWNSRGNCGLVVGATYPEELRTVRLVVGNMPILCPGIGKQGGDLEKALQAGFNDHKQGLIVNSSRGIIFASSGSDFADAARQKTLELHNSISQFLKGN